MLYAVIAVLLIGVVVFLFARWNAAYYGKIFSDAHYTEVGNWLVSVLKRGPIDECSFDDGTALRSSAECAFSLTRTISPDDDSIHIAISQIGRHTTHAVANRLAFLLLQILKENKADATFFYTECGSGVHHMVYVKETPGEWLTRDVSAAVADMELYEPLPFKREALQNRREEKDKETETRSAE